MNDGTILLVESDPILAEQATAALREEHFPNEVIVARDGIEAIDYLFEPTRGAEDSSAGEDTGTFPN